MVLVIAVRTIIQKTAIEIESSVESVKPSKKYLLQPLSNIH